jgi:hypothetical protein
MVSEELMIFGDKQNGHPEGWPSMPELLERGG